MPTTAFARLAAVTATAAVMAFAAASGATAQATTEAARPSSPETTGAIPDRRPPAPDQPAVAPATAPAEAKSPETKTTETPAGAVANAVTPAAPAATSSPAAPPADAAPAATSPSQTPPAATAPAAAAPAPDTPQPPATAAAPPAPPVDPVVGEARAWLGSAANTAKAHKDDVAAAVAFYGARSEGPLWVDAQGFTAKAKSAIEELNKADDWGLSADAFELPRFNVTAPSVTARGEAEARLTLELLKYARHARGGRVDPTSLSRIIDQAPPIKDANEVLAGLATAGAPDAYLRDLHPKHAQFQLLHKALLKARGPATAEVEVDPALKVRLPARQSVLKPGADDPEVALLRKRLKVPAEDGVAETEFDEKLEIALKAYQVEQQIRVTGMLGNVTRAALNRDVDALKRPDAGRTAQLIVLNMERWRWMPEDLGGIYVWNNIPEYITRVIKDGKEIFEEKIIVGKPSTATPLFSADMDFVGFNPTWGMPNGIKTRELAPRLRNAASNGGFLFFSTGPTPADVIRAYGLNVYRGSQQINPDSIDWSRADVRNFSFVQPPGPKNPLGRVKFIYRNKHDVYMHDTIEPNLFSSSNRALSNGCIRVRNPMAFAAIMLREGNGLDEEGVARAIRSGGEVRHTNRIPVHMTYFTTLADDGGRVTTFSDVYGHDSRLAAALTGRPLPRDVTTVETASTDGPPQRSRTAQQSRRTKTQKAPATLSDAITGFWLN